MTNTDPALGAAVRRLRHERGLTQEELAFSTDISISSLSRIERGASPNWASVKTIAATFDISLQELSAAVEEDEDTAAEPSA
jgi:transcriptional regulator with XRE-family HTH domain